MILAAAQPVAEPNFVAGLCIAKLNFPKNLYAKQNIGQRKFQKQFRRVLLLQVQRSRRKHSRQNQRIVQFPAREQAAEPHRLNAETQTDIRENQQENQAPDVFPRLAKTGLVPPQGIDNYRKKKKKYRLGQKVIESPEGKWGKCDKRPAR